MTSKFGGNTNLNIPKRLLKFRRSGLSLQKVMPSVPVLLTHPVYPISSLNNAKGKLFPISASGVILNVGMQIE